MKHVSTPAHKKRPALSHKVQQLHLRFSRRGGFREGSGRKKSRRGVPHIKRPALASRYPVIVTLDVEHDLPNLRGQMSLLRPIIYAAADQKGFRIVHFSVQRHHIHMVIEAKNAHVLSRCMQGLSIRIARQLNKKLGRRGRVFSDRYHSRILKTPAEVKNALAYVLKNALKHYAQRGRAQHKGWIDPCSSAHYFDGWLQLGGRAPPGQSPLPNAQTWLLSKGWRLHGLIDWIAVPSKRRLGKGLRPR